MNQKEYKLIGRIFKKNIEDTSAKALAYNVPVVSKAIAQQFADVLEKNYPKTFDRDKFLESCGLSK